MEDEEFDPSKAPLKRDKVPIPEDAQIGDASFDPDDDHGAPKEAEDASPGD